MLLSDLPFRKTSGITEQQKRMWDYSGVDFTIYITAKDGIEEGNIYKAKEGSGVHNRPFS